MGRPVLSDSSELWLVHGDYFAICFYLIVYSISLHNVKPNAPPPALTRLVSDKLATNTGGGGGSRTRVHHALIIASNNHHLFKRTYIISVLSISQISSSSLSSPTSIYVSIWLLFSKASRIALVRRSLRECAMLVPVGMPSFIHL